MVHLLKWLPIIHVYVVIIPYVQTAILPWSKLDPAILWRVSYDVWCESL